MLDSIPRSVLEDLRTRHAEPQRHYHDWTHIEALLGHLSNALDLVSDREAVLYAALFHDAVYDPKAKDNERRSAQLLMDTDLPISTKSRKLAERIILATERHQLPDDLMGSDLSDCALFLDMDLAILGASHERFDIYEQQIRREYSHVSGDAFREGRTKVLQHFARREWLYFSPWGRERFEARARANITRSLKTLTRHA